MTRLREAGFGITRHEIGMPGGECVRQDTDIRVLRAMLMNDADDHESHTIRLFLLLAFLYAAVSRCSLLYLGYRHPVSVAPL